MALAGLTPEQLLQKLQDAEQKLQEAEEKARGLSWPEALSLWHIVFANPKIRTRHQIIRASHFTSAIGRRHPKQLRHWASFHHLHEAAFTLVCNQLAKPEAGSFESRQFYETDARRFMSHCTLDDEVALVAYEQRTVEELVISAWQQKGDDQIGFKSRQDHSLDDVTVRLSQMNTGTDTARPTTPKKRLYDKVCYIVTGKAQRRDLFVIEYKAADKLTPDVVLEGLHDMELESIIQRIKVSTGEGKRRKEIAEEAIAAVVTQTFDYMVDQGLSYGYVNGGNAFIFLFIHPEDPQTLYYEKVILEHTSTTPSNISDEKLRLTAVGLVAGFAQMALSRQPLGETWRSKARKELLVWEIDEGKILDSLTPTPHRDHSEESPPFKEPNNHTSPDTSPAQTRSRTRKAKNAQAACQKGEIVLSRLRKDDDSSGTDANMHLGIVKSRAIQSGPKPAQDNTMESKDKNGSSKAHGQNKAAANFLQACEDYQANIAIPDRPYCTQACLLGLISGHALDKKCPNVRAHRKKGRYYRRNTNGKYKRQQQRHNRHALHLPDLVRLIDEQLQKPERDDNGGFKSLERSGWAGALFRLELLSHGYTFVAKGTVQPLVPVLQFEANMYKRMNTIQGKAIPVYLGSVDLISAFHLTTRTAIVHLMLLSWAGEEAWQCRIEPERLRLETVRTHREVAALGVQHRDLRPQNVLWNDELGRAILIDFEYVHMEEVHTKLQPAIAEETEAKKKNKVLGQISGNRVFQAGIRNNHPISKLCDGTDTHLVYKSRLSA